MVNSVIWDKSKNVLITPNGIIKAFNSNSTDFDSTIGPARDIVLSDLAEQFALISGSRESQNEASLTIESNYETPNPFRPYEIRLDDFIFYNDWGLILKTNYSFPKVTAYADVTSLIKPLLTKHGLSMLQVKSGSTGGPYGGEEPFLEMKIAINPDYTVGQVVAISAMLETIITEESMSPRSPEGAFMLVASGVPEALLGQPESQWLEAKRKGYGLENDRQKHELALDLAAFANTETGGLIVIGFSTQKDLAGQDIISDALGCTPGSLNIDQYAEVAKNRVVPNIEGLRMQVFAHGERHFLLALVPKQQPYLQPFLVKGGIVAESKTSGSAFTIPRRVGSEKWNMSAEAVHSQLVAARIALSNAQGANGGTQIPTAQ